MCDKEEIHDVAFYLRKFRNERVLTNAQGQLIFRGQANKKWNIISSAGRRLERENKKTQHDFVSYHVNLIANARSYGYGSLEANSQLTDLEMLAEIQHYGGATCLLDFSTNILIALWMATEENENNNGRIIWLDLGHSTNQSNIVYYNKHREGDTIQRILTKTKWNFELKQRKVEPCFWLWDPTKLNNRIIKQDSVFMFGLAAFPIKHEDDKKNKDARLHYNEIIIEHDDKKRLREELESIFGISAETVYYDMSGYAREANNSFNSISNKILPKNNCLYNAKESIKREAYSQAVNYLNDALHCKKNKSKCKREKPCDNDIKGELYFWKAVAHQERKEIEEALLNYHQAIKELNDDSNNPNLDKEKAKDIYKLLCEAYRKTSTIYYSRFDYIGAYDMDLALHCLYKSKVAQRSSNQKDEVEVYSNGEDAVLALLELSIIRFDKKEYDERLKESMYINACSNNGAIVLIFLRSIGSIIFKEKLDILDLDKNEKKTIGEINSNDLQEAFKEIDDKVDEIYKFLDNNVENNNKKDSLIGYFYWEYFDIINWIEHIQSKAEVYQTPIERFIVRNAAKFILLAQKARDAQQKLLNKVFAKSMAVRT